MLNLMYAALKLFISSFGNEDDLFKHGGANSGTCTERSMSNVFEFW